MHHVRKDVYVENRTAVGRGYAAGRMGAPPQGERKGLAIVFRYDEASQASRSLTLRKNAKAAKDDVGVAFLGAGNYAKSILLPAVSNVSSTRKLRIVTATGSSPMRISHGSSTASTSGTRAWPRLSILMR